MRLSDSDSIPSLKWVDSPFIAHIDVTKIQDEETTALSIWKTENQRVVSLVDRINGYNCGYEIQESNESVITTWANRLQNLSDISTHVINAMNNLSPFESLVQ